MPGLGVLCELSFLVAPLPDQAFDNVMGFIDVLKGAILQAARGSVIFFVGDVAVRQVEQFQGLAIASTAVHVLIDRGMVVQVLAVVDGSVPDLFDSPVDFGDGMLFFVIHVAVLRHVVQIGAGVAQIDEGVQVGGMPSWLVSESECGADREKEHEYGVTLYGFHSLLKGLSAETVVNSGLQV